jgi:hypothetical protein
LLVKDPNPDPFEVWDPLKTGSGEVPQQTPLEVTAEPPSDVTLPPEIAVVVVMPETAVVVTVGLTEFVLKEISFP